MVTEANAKGKAWVIFDRIVKDVAPGGEHTNPWKLDPDGRLRYEPDYETLVLLLGVPLFLNAVSQSGVPALALDVWLSYELRRAGFDRDATWPRPEHPRILPMPVARLLKALPPKERALVNARLTKKGAVSGVTSSTADILGKNYVKQVDVVMSDWSTGPELLISTKRMDSSFGKNAANRIEESYGDAKNLRLRHPLAALGFAFGLRSKVLVEEPDTAAWLIDLLAKLGQEDDAYHATCLILMEYEGASVGPGTLEVAERTAEYVVPEPGPEVEDDLPPTPEFDVGSAIKKLPKVRIVDEETPDVLSPSRFLEKLVTRLLNTTPINLHKEARRRRYVSRSRP